MSTKSFVSLLLTDGVSAGPIDLISQVPFDVCRSRSTRYQATVTDFPIESGSSISDHRRIQPNIFEMEGLVSATPIVTIPAAVQMGLKGDAEVGMSTIAPRELQAAHDALVDIHEKGKFVTIVDEYRTHENMVLESLDISKTKETGAVFEFKATFKKITVVKTSAAALPASVVKLLKRSKKKKTDTAMKLERQIAIKLAKGKIEPEDAKAQSSKNAAKAAAKTPKT